jgi:hypothetical protein
MSLGPQFGRPAGARDMYSLPRPWLRQAIPVAAGLVLCSMIVCLLTICSPVARADSAQKIVGHIQGGDASVETIAAGSDTISSAESGADVSNGSLVTVHSGEAHLTLISGGEVDICGPAKLTLLQAGSAITLALNFGRVRVQLPASADLRIFTPTIIATPLDIHGATRDVTAGLGLDDSLCVTAASGALLLENQFTGEKLVVPQAGEFSLAQGKLVPVAGAAGSCQCLTMQTKVIIPPPEPSLGLTAPAHVESPPAAAPTDAAKADPPAPKSSVEYSVLAYANEVRPIPPPAKPAPPAPPAESMPEYKIVMPPLTFSASSPNPPPDPTPDMVLLIRTVHVEPQWEFSGHVDAPVTDDSKRHATNASSAGNSQPQPAPAPPQKRQGFWAKVKKIFTGSSS